MKLCAYNNCRQVKLFIINVFLDSEERDIIILHHKIGVAWPLGRREMRTITFVEYGQPGGKTGMARTVGLPAAIATNMVLGGMKKV